MLRTVSLGAILSLAMAIGATAQPRGKVDAKPSGPMMRILSFTGQLQIKVGNEVIGVVAGGKMPEIPTGAEVIVVSGEAVFQAGDMVVKASGGDSFAFSAGKSGAIELAPTGDKTSLTVTVGGAEAKLETGDKIAVSAPSSGKAEIKVVTGSVSVTVNGRTSTLVAGKIVSAQTTTQIAQARATHEQQAGAVANPEKGSGTGQADSGQASSDSSSTPPAPPPPNPLQDTQIVSPSSP